MSRHISRLNYLWSAATCLTWTRTVIYWLSAPAITDSANKSHVFGGHFSQKSLSRTQTSDRKISQIAVLSSGDYDNACIHYEYRWWWWYYVVLQDVLYLASPACPSVPVTSGHLQCTDTFAWSRGCPFMTGTTVYDSTPKKLQQNFCQVDNLCKIVVDNILKIDKNRNDACG